MAHPQDKELKAHDSDADSVKLENMNPADDSDEEVVGKYEKADLDKKRIDHSGDHELRGPELQGVTLAASAATTITPATTATFATAPPGPPEKKPWHKKLNPLRWGSLPPVPAERMPSRECEAGFFSLLTFQWMSPLMSVCSFIPLGDVASGSTALKTEFGDGPSYTYT